MSKQYFKLWPSLKCTGRYKITVFVSPLINSVPFEIHPHNYKILGAARTSLQKDTSSVRHLEFVHSKFFIMAPYYSEGFQHEQRLWTL